MMMAERSGLLSEPLNISDVDAVGSFDGQSEDPGPDAVGQASKGSRNSEYDSVEVVFSHA